MPDISYIAREKAPRLTPISPVVVGHFADPPRLADASLVAPAWIIVGAVGRIGGHKMRRDALQRPSVQPAFAIYLCPDHKSCSHGQQRVGNVSLRNKMPGDRR